MDITYLDTDVMENLNDLKIALPNVKSVPQIWLNDEHIGGYDDFAKRINA